MIWAPISVTALGIASTFGTYQKPPITATKSTELRILVGRVNGALSQGLVYSLVFRFLLLVFSQRFVLSLSARYWTVSGFKETA